MQNLNRSLKLINAIIAQMTAASDEDLILDILLSGSIDLLGVDAGAVIAGDNTATFCKACSNIHPDAARFDFAKIPVLPANIRDVGLFNGTFDEIAAAGVKSVLCLRVDTSDGRETRLGLFSFNEREFSADEIHCVEILTSTVRSAVKNSMNFKMIAQSQKLWINTFDAIKDFLFVTDENRVIIKNNLAFASYAGGQPKDLIGKTCLEVFNMDRPHSDCVFSKACGKGCEFTAEVELQGETYILSGFPIDSETGTNTVVHVMKNITEMKKLREQLYYSDKLSSIGMLVSGVAHEINNPLTGLLGYTELLQMKTDDEELIKELEKIHFAAERCKTIVENLLTFSRQRPSERSFENANEIIDKTVELRSYWLKTNGIALVRDYSEVPYTMLDAQQIQQVILNMITNSEYAIGQLQGSRKGIIRIRTQLYQGPRMIGIEIMDNGTGIKTALMRKIFDPFYTTKPVDKGTGLGLSISHGIIKEHGGSIDVSSVEGEYTSFLIRLPVVEIDT